MEQGCILRIDNRLLEKVSLDALYKSKIKIITASHSWMLHTTVKLLAQLKTFNTKADGLRKNMTSS